MLIDASRPRTFDDVVGQTDAVNRIKSILATGWGSRAWLLTGLSGVGKTTLAKLIAAEGASDIGTEELACTSLTPAGVHDIERDYQCRALGEKTGRAVILNEVHRLRRDTVAELLDVLERIPGHVCWVFTATTRGFERFIAEDETGDSYALASRMQHIKLADNADSRVEMARRAKTLAQAAGIDGYPDIVYRAALDHLQGNMRMLLQRIESRSILDTAHERVMEMMRTRQGDPTPIQLAIAGCK